MIITGRSRSDWQHCAESLMREGPNESARLVEVVGLLDDTVRACLHMMWLVGQGMRAENFFYHATIRPRAHELRTEEQWYLAVEILGRHLGLSDSPRFVVERVEHGRIHREVVWSRVDYGAEEDFSTLKPLKVVHECRYDRKHRRAARALEAYFGHKAVPRWNARQPIPEATP